MRIQQNYAVQLQPLDVWAGNMKLNILLLFTTAFILLNGCSKFEIDESSLMDLTECTPGVSTTTTPCVVLKSNYVYSTAYGGRSTVGANLLTTSGGVSGPITLGWYDGNTAAVNDLDLRATNIRSGVTIFGVTGELVPGVTFPLCTVPGTTDSEGKIGGSCKAVASQFVYDTEYGGRNNICVENVALTAPCWLKDAGRYIITDTTSVVNCSVEGEINPTCVVASTNYWYTTAYGGRSANCTIETTNVAACWTNRSGNTYIRSNNPCVSGYNGGSCQTAVSAAVYTTEYGGRNVNCTSNNVGSCWFAAAKNIVETNLATGNIRQNRTIFGVAGSFTGVLTEWGSGMSRATSTTTNVLTYVSETTTFSGASGTALPAYYYAVPKISLSDDGYVVSGQITIVDRSTWSTTSCGTASATIGARITDCANILGAETTWNGKAKGHNGEGIWKLVTRTGSVSSGKGREVWQDQSTGLMWSSVVSTGINWCKASGSSNSIQSDIIAGNYNEDDPSDICDNSFYQVQTASPISACEDAIGFSTTDTDIDNSGKAGLVRTSTPKVSWRLPTIYDYMVANHDGLRFVMPDAGNANTAGTEWTATVDSTDRSKAWLFDPTTGTRSKDERRFVNAVRCIGR
ncbi:hypothetical protein CIK05_13645 [Bdellovibrio sp. qaytius]|nr:hypothetical protein CIK05_13645 [Bdellovibrio sp. qaytius]